MKKSKKRFLGPEDDPLEGDLSEWMQTGPWYPVRFEFRDKKSKTITLRISERLLTAVKGRAEKLGIDYQKYIRLTLEESLRKKSG